MSALTVNGLPALEASIALPLVGVSTFTIAMLEQDLPAGNALQVQLGDDLVWQATVRRKGVNAGRGLLQAVGGAGGMRLELEPRSYLGVPLRIPLSDLVSDAGERLAGTSDATILATNLPAWTRTRESASRALGALLAAVGSPSWRILPDGSLWVGPEAWPESKIQEWTITAEVPQNGVIELHSLAPAIFPGETFDGRRVVRVEHHVSSRQMLTRLHVEDARAGAPDRMWASFERLVRRVFSRIDYLARYPARVVGQNADLTLELVPDDDRLLPSYSRVPIRFGVPGMTARVPGGARVLLGFAAGDPTKPQAELWESADPTEITLGTGTSQPAALATALRTELDAIWAAIYGGHGHPYTWTDGSGAGTTSPASGSASTQTIASSVVRVRV